MFRSTFQRLIPILVFSALGLLGGAEETYAQCGSCVSGMYIYCNGDCPSQYTGQGECTTRYDATCQPEKWCCCDNSFVLEDAPNTTTTTGGYGPVVGDCPRSIDTDEDEKDQTNPWAATAAIQQTSNPSFTDNVLRLVRDNVLNKSARGKGYIDAVYKYSDDVEKLLAANPRLVKETAAMMSENLPLLLQLGNGKTISVEKSKVQQALVLLEKYADAASKNPGLKQALADAMRGLKDRQLLTEMGIRVVD